MLQRGPNMTDASGTRLTLRGSLDSIRQRRVMDIDLHDVDVDETLRVASLALRSGEGLFVATPNVDYAIRARRDPEFRDAIAAADLRVPDGMWIVYASRIAGRPLRSTVTGRLLLPALAQIAADGGLPIALVGGPPGVAGLAANRLRSSIPGLRIALVTAPPMGFRLGSEEDDALVRQVLQSEARLVFVALGAPRQERWIAQHLAAFDGLVVVGVGAAFDIVAGRFREAPRWMTRYGLEWLFRLAQEPRRLARRYLIDDPAIIGWAVRTRLGLGRD